jgi:tetratricopeptide (TPR) repeat protein
MPDVKTSGAIGRLSGVVAGSAMLVLAVSGPALARQAGGAPVQASDDPRPVTLVRPETPAFTAALAARLAAGSNDPGLAAAAMNRAARDAGATDGMRLSAVSAALDAGDFTTAAAVARSLTVAPRSGRALVALAAPAWIARDWRSVVSTLSSGQFSGPDGAVGRTLLAWSQYETGQRDAALASLSAGTGDTATDFINVATRGLMLDAAGRRDEALAAYASFWAVGIPVEEIGVRYALLLQASGDQAEASAVLDTLLESPRDRARLEALRDGRGPRWRRLANDQARGASMTVLAVFLMASAETAWPGELAIQSTNVRERLLLTMGAHYLSKNNKPAAEAAFRGIAPGAPDYPDAVVQLAAMGIEENPAGVLADLDRALAVRQDSGQLLLMAGFAETRLKNYAGAVSRYTQLIEGIEAGRIQAPASLRAQAHVSRGVLHDTSGALDAAEADYRAAYRLTPQDAGVLNALGYFLADRSRDAREAERLLLRAVSAEPRNGSYVDSLGWAQFRLGNFEQAVALLERAAILEPRQSVIADHLGDAYWRTGRLVEARLEWRKVLSLIKPGDLGEPDPAVIEAKIRDGLPPLAEASASVRGASQ